MINMIICSICCVPKPETEFYYHTRNGVKTPFSSCKQCHKDSVRFYRQTPRGREVSRECCKRQSKSEYRKAKNRKHSLKWARNNKHKRSAHDRLLRAVKKGLIVKPNCCSICHQPCKPEAHHPDYSKPLEVLWLCQPCHRNQHPDIFSRKSF